MISLSFIIHGKIRHYEKIIASIKECFGSEYQLDFLVSLYRDHNMELAYEAVNKGVTHIISVGGDGSLNGIVNGIMWAKNKGALTDDAWNKLRVGLLPNGTGNDFAKTMKIELDVRKLKRLVERDSYTLTDIGLVEYHTRDRVEISRYFINVSDVGIGGFVVRNLAASTKALGAALSYQVAIISNLLTYTNKPVKMTAGDFAYEGRIKTLIIANGKYFAGGLCLGPDISVTDGLFSIVLAGEISLFDYLRNIGKMRSCQKIEHPEVKYLTSKEVFIDSPYPLPVDVDGEAAGCTPVKLTLIPGALRFISPVP